ncbi:MAG: adenylate/guanylate cyclase domain-containing protein [Candidatus Rifleibacteriota bacterium]
MQSRQQARVGRAKVNCQSCNQKVAADFSFCGYCGKPLRQEITPNKAYKNERRDVAVLFADVSGFTSMCETMDPEDVFTLMNEVFAGLGKAISDQGGHIDKYIGDNVMALFGAPVAHEDDPSRACMAALNMQKFLHDFALKLQKKTGVLLKMRIGINCGLVLAGSIGSDVKREYSVLGDNVNLASRLESNAPPGGVLVSASIAGRIKGFELGEAREIKVKGKVEPVTAFELLGLEKHKEQQLIFKSPLIGREKELAMLKRALDENAGLILVAGDAGTGKTRLVHEIVKGRNLLVWVSGQQNSTPSPFALFRRFLRRVMIVFSGNEESVNDPEKARNFFIGLDSELFLLVPALLHLLFPEDLPLPDQDPTFLRKTTEAALSRVFSALHRKYPDLLLVLDAFDFADEASIVAFKRIFETAAAGNFQTIITARKRSENLSTGVYLEVLPLSEKHSEKLFHELLKEVEIGDQNLRAFIEKSAGNPLFVEELAAWTIRTRQKGNREDLLLPPSLRALAISRIDQLSQEGRDFIRICSVQGSQFSMKLAMDSASISAGKIRSSIMPELQQAEIADPVPGRSDLWAFRHPLMQEVCYETMMLADRKKLHLATANSLQKKVGGSFTPTPELLAFHYERAEDWFNSSSAKLQAAERSRSFGLNQEAGQLYLSAQKDLNRLDQATHQAKSLFFRTFQGLTQVQIRTGATEEAIQTVAQLENFCEKCGQRVEAFRLKAELARIQGNFSAAEECFKQAEKLFEHDKDCRDNPQFFHDYAEHLNKAARYDEALIVAADFRKIAGHDTQRLIQADSLEAKILYAQGNFAAARPLFLKAYRMAQKQPGLSEKARCANNLGNVERDLGNYTKARGYFFAALNAWEKAGDVEGVAGANNNLGNLAMSLGDYKLAQQHHSETLKSWLSMGNLAGAVLSQANLAILSLELQNGEQAVNFAREAMKNLGASGNVVLVSLVRVIEAEGLLLLKMVDDAESGFKKVLEEFNPDKAKLAHAGASRGLGKVCLLKNREKEALAYFEQAQIAYSKLKRSQEAARTQILVAETMLKMKRHPEAQTLLLAVEKEFQTMKAARDLKKVRAMLKKISRS